MTKNIIIGVLVVLCGFFVFFAHIQKEEALRQNGIVNSNLESAKQKEDEMNQKISEIEGQVASLQEALDNCQSPEEE